MEDPMSTLLRTAAEDLWDDIPPVRHSKYKNRGANELAPILLERILAVATNPGDLVIDPFGGSGTTYYAAEKMGRRWLGTEIGDTTAAIQRLSDYANGHFVEWESARRIGPRLHGKSKQPQVVEETNGVHQPRLFEKGSDYTP
jgi:site-specific DNA-methyltransferase (adenine-specific)